MNAKLLSDARKALNAQNRRQRENARVTIRRRREALHGLAVACSSSPQLIDLLDPNDALSLIGGDLKAINPSLPRLLRLAVISARRAPEPPVFSSQSPGPPRPRRQVRRRSLPKLYPSLVSSNVPAVRISIAAAMREARDRCQRGRPSGEILDRFQADTGLPWETARDLLSRHGLLKKAITDDMIGEYRAAREFWWAWQDAQQTWKAAVALGQIQPFLGEWGLVEERQLARLLPGFLRPAEEKRSEYVVELVQEGESAFELRFFSSTYRPAFWLRLDYAAEEAVRLRRRGCPGSIASVSATSRGR